MEYVILFLCVGVTVSLSLWNYGTLTDIRGLTRTFRHGDDDDSSSTAMELNGSTTPAITGTNHQVTGQLATASVVTAWDDDNDTPADFDYLHYVADQDSYIQIIGSGTNVIFKCAAKVPFVLPGFDTILAAADTTAITGGSEPSLTDIDSIVVGNYSGTTMNFTLTLID